MQPTTPLMKQYHEMKQRCHDALLLFQVGDFYELFFDDAKKASAFLGITLTKRGKQEGEPIPLCGVPVHTLEHYVSKLVRGGFKVALCDQLTEAIPGKVVERGITRVFTPGTLTESGLLDAKHPSYLFSFFPHQDTWGLLFGELLTAQLYATTVAANPRTIEAELARFFPDEIIIPDTKLGKSFQTYFKKLGYMTSLVASDIDAERTAAAHQWIAQMNNAARHHGQYHEALRAALTSFYLYVSATHAAAVEQCTQLTHYNAHDFLMLDAATQRNLELVVNNDDGDTSHTLLAVLDDACTGMGSRLIKKWIVRPLIDQQAIAARQDAVETLLNNAALLRTIQQLLRTIGDAERIVGRIALRRATVTDYVMLKHILQVLPRIVDLCANAGAGAFMHRLFSSSGSFQELYALLSASLDDDATAASIIKIGYNAELDGMRQMIASSAERILHLEQQEQQATGIGSLKIRHNQVHGYSIEITKTHYHAVPAHYIRRQTLVGRERYTTPQLLELETAIVKAHEESGKLEKELFDGVKHAVAHYIPPLRAMAHALANLDAITAFASLASVHGYTRPLLTSTRDIIITQGRHPVVERALAHRFIPNDLQLNDTQSVMIITGPNMGGKSTYLRQNALIAIMAHCGSFVPAKFAQIPIMDRIFTRIGAGDHLVGGKSTFMVEMEETAAICTQATERSLVILDEVGRGTSTFDGLAIAQAVVEYIHTKSKARCLFATHYHELTQLHEQFPAIANFYAASMQEADNIVFLYKIMAGVAHGSFGLQVAKLAKLPSPILIRAQEIINMLAQGQGGVGVGRVHDLVEKNRDYSAIIDLLRQVDLNNLSPRQALELVWRLKDALK